MSIFSNYQPLHFITVNQENAYKLESLAQSCQGVLWLPQKLTNNSLTAQYYPESLAQHLQQIWSDSQAIVFCLTMGAVVRLIAPLLQDKQNDPAVIVITPQFDHVISLTGGHQGKAEQLTKLIANQLQANSIVTSASSALNLPSIDTFGAIYGWRKGEGDWTRVSANITNQQTTLVKQTSGLRWWQNRLPKCHPFTEEAQDYEGLIYIGIEEKISACVPSISWHPQQLWVGIGCERNTPLELIESALQEVLTKYNLSPKSIASLVTIDIKQDEVGILQLAQKWELPLQTYSAQELKTIEVPNPSPIVAREVGTASVAEASAIKGASFTNWENNQAQLIVPKQIIRHSKGAVTIAIARSTLEYNPHPGQLYLIGTGPGNTEYLTKIAHNALLEADVIIGYGLYIDLIKTLLRPEQIIESYSITQEKQRAERAIELAKWGLKVAVISSGDCGIYGMAGLVLEILTLKSWDGKNPSVSVFSGITALQSLAAKVGSPLMHDFCAISLSDLLTPWEVIVKRIVAAANGDFVTAIYNPRSATRQQQIVKLQEIFLQYRDHKTPVAIARSLGRKEEKIILTTLAEMLNHSIDMLTTVMIGNSSSKRYGDLLITPRGYRQLTS